MTIAARRGEQVGAVLVLDGVAGLGPRRIQELIDRHGGPLAALEAAPADLDLPPDVRKAAAKALKGRAAGEVAGIAARRASRELEPGDRLLAYGVAGYPARLHRLHFPPPLLWARGPLPADAPRALAIVGTRRATPPARELAREIAAAVARRGIRIVSGLAAGIDGAAHRGALAAGGETVGVLGSGLRQTYPLDNADLYGRLPATGLILSEFPPRVRAVAHNFPRRNRIVAALADAVLVVQAGRDSGALITAREAAEIGIDVLACPGDVRLAASAGCHDLIREGAGLVASAADVFAALGVDPLSPPAPAGRDPAPAYRDGSSAAAIVERLAEGPATLGELAGAAGGVAAAAALLARLELAGAVIARPGGRYEAVVPRAPAAPAGGRPAGS